MKVYLAASVILAGVAAAGLTPFAISGANAKPSGVFHKLDGTWRGKGKITLADGNSQRINCRAYYNVKDEGAGLGFAIRCAAPGNKIELRASLEDTNGRVSGTWEERTFNATGQVTGTVSSTRVDLRINGAVSGSVKISYSRRRQSVSISTATESLKGIAINLRR